MIKTLHVYSKFISEGFLWKGALKNAWRIDFSQHPSCTKPLSPLPHIWCNQLSSTKEEEFFRRINSSMQCYPPSCPAGFVNQYGATKQKNDSLFDMAHGPKCELCPANHVKLDFGPGKCEPCHGKRNIDNGQRTACIDQYQDVFLTLNKAQLYVLNALVLSGLLSTLLISVVFLVHRNTVIVRVSDLGISMVHLGAVSVTYSCTWLTFTDVLDVFSTVSEDNMNSVATVCLMRQLIKTIPYTLNVALVYTRSEKLLSAFKSKIRVTVDEIRKTTAVQVFTVLCFIVVSNLVALVLFNTYQHQKLLEKHDDSRMRRVYTCNTDTSNNVLNCVLAFFHLACLVQAFRGRKLPAGIWNNAMTLVFSSLVTSLVLSVSFPISHFQEDQEKLLVQCLVLLVNCHVNLALLYGSKVFVVLFQPHKNTRQYLNEKRLKSVSIGSGVDLTESQHN